MTILSKVKTLIEYAKCGMGYSQIINNEDVSIAFPKSIQSLANWACPANAVSIESQYDIALKNNQFSNCSKLKRAIFPKITTVPEFGFGNTGATFEEVDFSNLERVGNYGFIRASFKGDVTFPKLKSIGTAGLYSVNIMADDKNPTNEATLSMPALETLSTSRINCLSVSIIKLPSCHTLLEKAFEDNLGTRRIEVGALKSMHTNSFNSDGWAAMEEFIVAKGTTSSIYVQKLEYLTQECLHNIIDNYANMNGQTSPIFSMGSANLEKVSDEYKAKAVSKNITLK